MLVWRPHVIATYSKGSAGVFAEHSVAGVGGDALGRMHGDRIPEADMLAQVVTIEDDTGVGPQVVRRQPDSSWASMPAYAPPVPVTHRRQRLGMGSGVVEPDGGVVAPADNQIAHRDAVPAPPIALGESSATRWW